MTNTTEQVSDVDRRRWRRVPLHAPVQINCGDRVHVGQVRDISAGGLAVSRIESPLAEELTLVVALPSGDAAERRLCMFEGRVVWQTDETTGIELDEPPVQDLLAVLNSVIGN